MYIKITIVNYQTTIYIIPPMVYNSLTHIHNFVGPFTKEEEARILNTAIRVNKRNPAERQLGQMWNETRKILTEFYSSHNENLAKLLSSDKFLWND